ncbi:DUF3631 domain-containing protein [Streptomyces sp. NPDC059743]|uniref:DUF3631 domain-containing protein n=1 Tax=Streptomyces sp. NPDC059743 TaxID=3346928 RepID=UPI00365783B3
MPWDHPRRLQLLLKDYGISSANHRFPGGTQAKGFARNQFLDAWARYCPAQEPAPATHARRYPRAPPSRSTSACPQPHPPPRYPHPEAPRSAPAASGANSWPPTGRTTWPLTLPGGHVPSVRRFVRTCGRSGRRPGSWRTIRRTGHGRAQSGAAWSGLRNAATDRGGPRALARGLQIRTVPSWRATSVKFMLLNNKHVQMIEAPTRRLGHPDAFRLLNKNHVQGH